MRALISVSNKEGLIPFCTKLHKLGFELVSTSGTAKAIEDAGLPCTQVAKVTGFPEMLDGRVRTLHPNIFAGIIADQQNQDHMLTLKNYAIKIFHLVVVNMYDFVGTPSIEQIDVGGPSMLRAAAKNYTSVTPVCDPVYYDPICNQIESNRFIDRQYSFRMAVAAFRHTANYEAKIAEHFEDCIAKGIEPAQGKKH